MTEADDAGNGEAPLPLALRPGRKADVALLDVRLDAPAELDHSPPTSPRAAMISAARPAERDLPARRPLRELTQGEARDGGIEGVQGAGADRRGGVGAGGGEGLRGDPLERLALLRELLLRLGDHPLRVGTDLREHGQHLASNPIAREHRLHVGGVVAEGEARLGRELTHLLSTERHASGVPRTPARPQAQQGTTARGGRQPVDDGLRQIGAGVAGGHPVESPIRPKPLGCRVAGPTRLRLEVPLAEARSLHDQVEAEPSAERTARSPRRDRSRAEARN